MVSEITEKTQVKKIDLSLFFHQLGIPIGNRPAVILETPGMYPHKAVVPLNWSFFTAHAMARLADLLPDEGRKAVAKIAIVGIGSGVEGILASHYFKSTLQELIISDIDPEIIYGATQNIKAINPETEILPVLGAYCEPIIHSGFQPDLIFGNIPNLPVPKSHPLNTGAERGTFVPQDLYENYNPPKELVEWGLGSQFAFLQSAKKCLPAGGSVVTALGARMPEYVVEALFSSCGLKIQEVVVGFKQQTEPLIDLQGYYGLEKANGVSFDFYHYEEAESYLAQHHLLGPSFDITGPEMKKMLEHFQLNANEALSYFGNIRVGHVVQLLRGIKEE